VLVLVLARRASLRGLCVLRGLIIKGVRRRLAPRGTVSNLEPPSSYWV
jgi:hypothetical protein